MGMTLQLPRFVRSALWRKASSYSAEYPRPLICLGVCIVHADLGPGQKVEFFTKMFLGSYT